MSSYVKKMEIQLLKASVKLDELVTRRGALGQL